MSAVRVGHLRVVVPIVLVARFSGWRFSAAKFRMARLAACAGNPCANSQRNNRREQGQQSRDLRSLGKFLLTQKRTDAENCCGVKCVDESLRPLHVNLEPL